MQKPKKSSSELPALGELKAKNRTEETFAFYRQSLTNNIMAKFHTQDAKVVAKVTNIYLLNTTQ